MDIPVEVRVDLEVILVMDLQVDQTEDLVVAVVEDHRTPRMERQDLMTTLDCRQAEDRSAVVQDLLDRLTLVVAVPQDLISVVVADRRLLRR
jgi:hypothetical protein